MLKLKKLIALTCSAILAATTLIVPSISVSAAYDLSYGVNSVSITTSRGVTKADCELFLKGTNNAEMVGGILTFYVTKGVFSAVSASGYDDKGTCSTDGSYKLPTYEAGIMELSDNTKYDRLNVLFYGSLKYSTEDDIFGKLTLNFSGGAQDFELIPSIDFSDDQSTKIQFCDASGAVTETVTTAENTYTYQVSSTGTVTKTAISTEPDPDPVVWTATAAGTDYTGEYDGSKAAAYTVELAGDGTTYNAITWKATKDGVTKGHVTALNPDLGGEGSFKFGIAIGGVATSELSDVKAAWGDQTPSSAE